MSDTLNQVRNDQIGRNEPCPCGSGKKYKRCCGVGAAPKLTAPHPTGMGAGAPGLPAGFDPSSLSQEEQQQMVQFAQNFQRLPKGQLQRLQSIMQRAMNGKDVTREADELESSLPPEFQEMLKNFKMPNVPGLVESQMSEDEARAIVAKAAQEGKISQDQAHSLLEKKPERPEREDQIEATDPGGISKLWKKLSGGNKV